MIHWTDPDVRVNINTRPETNGQEVLSSGGSVENTDEKKSRYINVMCHGA